MADGTVTLEAIARFDRLETALARLQKKNESLEKQIAKGGAAHNRFESAASKGLLKLARNALTVAGTYASIHQGIRLVTSAITDQIEKQRLAAQMSRTFEESRNEFLTQIGRLSPEQKEQLETRVLAAGTRAGLDRNMIFPTFRSAFSSTDELDVTKRMERSARVFEESTELFGRSLQNFPRVQGGILQIQRLTQDTLENTAGKVVRFIEQSAADDPGVITKVAQVISAQIEQTGALTPAARQRAADDAMAILTTLMAAGFDPEAAMSRTAASNLDPVLREALGATRDTRSTVELLKQFVEEGPDPDTVKFKGKSFTKEMQRGLTRDLADTAGTISSILAEQIPIFRAPVGPSAGVVKGLQSGVSERQRRAVLGTFSTQARGEELLEKLAGPEGAVKDLLFGIKGQTGAFAGLGFFQRGALRARLGFGQLTTGEEVAEEVGIGVLGNQIFKRLERERIRSGGPRQFQAGIALPAASAVGVQGLLTAKTTDPITLNMQQALAELIRIIAARETEATRNIESSQQADADIRKAALQDYSKAIAELKDVAEGISNSGTAAGRVNAESENDSRIR